MWNDFSVCSISCQLYHEEEEEIETVCSHVQHRAESILFYMGGESTLKSSFQWEFQYMQNTRIQWNMDLMDYVQY